MKNQIWIHFSTGLGVQGGCVAEEMVELRKDAPKMNADRDSMNFNIC